MYLDKKVNESLKKTRQNEISSKEANRKQSAQGKERTEERSAKDFLKKLRPGESQEEVENRKTRLREDQLSGSKHTVTSCFEHQVI